ncbi:MAG: hypothetical protein ACRCWQ_14440 [Bacilli bacterium]
MIWHLFKWELKKIARVPVALLLYLGTPFLVEVNPDLYKLGVLLPIGTAMFVWGVLGWKERFQEMMPCSYLTYVAAHCLSITVVALYPVIITFSLLKDRLYFGADSLGVLFSCLFFMTLSSHKFFSKREKSTWSKIGYASMIVALGILSYTDNISVFDWNSHGYDSALFSGAICMVFLAVYLTHRCPKRSESV